MNSTEHILAIGNAELRIEVDRLTAELEQVKADHAELVRALDNIKIRGYELGSREIHDMALAAIQGSNKE